MLADEIIRNKVSEEKEKKQDDGCPDCFCEDCDKNCLAKEFGLIK